jgi:HEAT repeat protein
VKGGAPGARAAAFAEMATLPLPEATARLCNHLKDPNLAARREVILALGRRGDPAAVDPLLASLDSRDAATFPATAQALAKLGQVKAVDPLLRILEGKDAEPALAVANALPELLLQIRDREVLERALGRMIGAYEQSMASESAIAPKSLDQPVPTALRIAIQLTTGRTFPSPVEARMWWNKDGKKFVEDRVK